MKSIIYMAGFLLAFFIPAAATPQLKHSGQFNSNYDGCLISSATLYPHEADESTIIGVLRNDFITQCLKRPL